MDQEIIKICHQLAEITKTQETLAGDQLADMISRGVRDIDQLDNAADRLLDTMMLSETSITMYQQYIDYLHTFSFTEAQAHTRMLEDTLGFKDYVAIISAIIGLRVFASREDIKGFALNFKGRRVNFEEGCDTSLQRHEQEGTLRERNIALGRASALHFKGKEEELENYFDTKILGRAGENPMIQHILRVGKQEVSWIEKCVGFLHHTISSPTEINTIITRLQTMAADYIRSPQDTPWGEDLEDYLGIFCGDTPLSLTIKDWEEIKTSLLVLRHDPCLTSSEYTVRYRGHATAITVRLEELRDILSHPDELLLPHGMDIAKCEKEYQLLLGLANEEFEKRHGGSL